MEIPEESQRLFDMGFGAVVAAFTQVIGYYFGSSMGSKQNKLNERNRCWIQTYAQDSNVTFQDKLIGTDSATSQQKLYHTSLMDA